MLGYVSAHQALLNVTFRLMDQTDEVIESVIDTGFIGFMTLSMDTIQALNLPFIRRTPANLAEDSTIFVEVYAANISWNGEHREIEVLATGSRPLIGTLLLEGNSLNVQFAKGLLVNVDSQ